MGKPRRTTPGHPKRKSVVISARVRFDVAALLDQAARILGRHKTRQDVLVEGATRLAREIVRSAAVLRRRARARR